MRLPRRRQVILGGVLVVVLAGRNLFFEAARLVSKSVLSNEPPASHVKANAIHRLIREHHKNMHAEHHVVIGDVEEVREEARGNAATE